jgi:hypothetical protein
MTWMSRFLMGIARAIAGRARIEWLDAMEAEVRSADLGSTTWAIGCVWAALKDRMIRDRWFFGAVLLLSACDYYWKTAVFFSTSSLLVKGWIPDWLTMALWIVSPFPIAFFFGRMRQGPSAYAALAISLALAEFTPFLIAWLKFGISPLVWFDPHSNWYKAGDNLAMAPVPGLACDILVWIGAAWLGSHSVRKATN